MAKQVLLNVAIFHKHTKAMNSIDHMLQAMAHLEQAAQLEPSGIAAQVIYDLTSDIEHAIEDLELLRSREERNFEFKAG